MLVSHFMITYLPAIGKQKGSFPLPAHWEGGARVNITICKRIDLRNLIGYNGVTTE